MDATLLQELKATYGNIYEVDIKGHIFYVRELRRAEYRYILDNFRDTADTVICQATCVFPEGYDFEMRAAAGVTANLADQVVFLSNLQSAAQYEQLLEVERQKMQSFEAQGETFIAQAFKDISFEEMGNWTMETFMKYLARAEWALRNVWQLPVEFRPKNEGEEGEEQSEEPPFTMQDMAHELRQEGIDPMMYLLQDIKEQNRKPFVEFPLIGGTKLLENEEVLESVREQIQRLSK